MGTEAYINITLQSFGGLISLMIIIFIKYVRRDQSKSDHLYINFLFCNTLLLFSNVLSWCLDGGQGTLTHIIIVAVNCAMYILHYLLLGTITSYLSAYLTDWGIKCKWFTRAVWSIVALGILLVVISQFNGMYYYIDVQNLYQRGDWFLLFPIIGIIGATLILTMLLCQYRQLHSKEYRTFVTLLILAILALVVQAVFYGAVYLYITSTFVAICIYVFIQAEQARKLSQQALELERNRTAIMMSQIQPHFLYNSLLGIKQLCDTQPQKASDALEHFAYYLRGNLHSISEARLIPFSKEQEHLEDYLYLEQMRFGDLLKIDWQVEFTDFWLPPLTLQPLAENAVRHGITKKDEGGTLIIKSQLTANAVLLLVIDDGVGFDPNATPDESRPHIGIENVKQRIEALCGGQVMINSAPGIGTEVTISLPRKEPTHEDNCS